MYHPINNKYTKNGLIEVTGQKKKQKNKLTHSEENGSQTSGNSGPHLRCKDMNYVTIHKYFLIF